MKCSIEEIKACYVPTDKSEDDALWMVKYLVRPLSFYFTWFFVRMNLSANQVTIISLMIGLLGSGLLINGEMLTNVTGCILLICWLVLDHVDGNLARFYKTQSKFGDFLDTIACYSILAAFPLALGIGTAVNHIDINPLFALLMAGLGGLIAILNILPRLFYQKMRSYKTDNKSYQASINGGNEYSVVFEMISITYSVAQNLINPSGFLFALLLLAILLGQVPIFLAIYTFILAGGLVLSTRRVLRDMKGM